MMLLVEKTSEYESDGKIQTCHKDHLDLNLCDLGGSQKKFLLEVEQNLL